MKQNWYEKTIEQSLTLLETSSEGLSDSAVFARQKEYGPNKLPEAPPDSVVMIFLRQFKSPLVYVLLAVSVVVFAFGEHVDSLVIAIVLLLNAIVGAVQEGRAQNTLAALKRFVQTQTLVRRNGKEESIPDEELVPGDIVILHEGGKIPADGRIIASSNIALNESSITGESGAVQKIIEPLTNDENGHTLYPPEQRNMLFKGSHVVAGDGEMVVTQTGVRTLIGQLSKSITESETEIPLQVNIRNLSRIIMTVVTVASVILFCVGILYGNGVIEMIKTVVSLAVSVIPEGLPVVLTVVLANGVWRMSQRKALVKKLAAVEALGQATVIAVDKTGTITKNELFVETLVIHGKTFEVTGAGYDPAGSILHNKKAVSPLDVPELVLAGRISAYASAELFYVPHKEMWEISGDPTEAAMLVFAHKVGFKTEEVMQRHPVVQKIPFDYHVKYRMTVFRDGTKLTAAIVGAPEAIAKLCGIPENDMHQQIQSLVQGGMRVIAFGVTEVDGVIDPEHMPVFTFGGLFGMRDAMHAEVPDAVAMVQSAGIRTIMITGDHKLTAQAIAKSANIFKSGDLIITGAELDTMDDDVLAEKLKTVSVFARIVPEMKLRIVKVLQKNGNIVAMTGDGINDVPSIVAADLGIAMGIAGTEVTKEAADIVLLDDNFATIASAVEEGRNIYKTIQRALLYLFSTSIGEFFTVAVALFIGLPLPVIAVQILWLNFVTDGFLTLSFAMEPNEETVMQKRFHKPNKYLIDMHMLVRMAIMGMVMSIGTLILFNVYKDGDYVKATTIAMTVLAVFQWFNAWNCRSEKKSILHKPFTNLSLIGATILVALLQISAVYTPFMQKLLKTTTLTLQEWLVILGVASSVIIVEEMRKLIARQIKN